MHTMHHRPSALEKSLVLSVLPVPAGPIGATPKHRLAACDAVK